MTGTTGKQSVLRYVATVQLGGFTQEVLVWELPEAGLKHAIIGQDVLRRLLVVLSGTEKRVSVKLKTT